MVDIAAQQAYIEGLIDIYGSTSYDELTFLRMWYYGAGSTTNGGLSSGLPTASSPTTG